MNKKVFTVKDENGNDLELAIRKPTAKIRIDSQLIYNKTIKQAIESGSFLVRNIEKEAEKLGLWDDAVKKEVEETVEKIRSLELKLRSGGNSFSSKEDAKACALEMKELRSHLFELNRGKDELYPYTAESFADDARVKYFVSQCCVDNNTGKNYFKNYEDFILNSDGEIAAEALAAYYELMYDDVSNFQSAFYENQWLKEYGYVDDKYRLINSEGKLVDSEGRLLDENGRRYVLADGTFCDRGGNPVDTEGNYIVDFKPFD